MVAVSIGGTATASDAKKALRVLVRFDSGGDGNIVRLGGRVFPEYRLNFVIGSE